ncbi:MAG: hypothetical protein AB7P76_05640 [Candidatus Melainabacteria bacterium]
MLPVSPTLFGRAIVRGGDSDAHQRFSDKALAMAGKAPATRSIETIPGSNRNKTTIDAPGIDLTPDQMRELTTAPLREGIPDVLVRTKNAYSQPDIDDVFVSVSPGDIQLGGFNLSDTATLTTAAAEAQKASRK